MSTIITPQDLSSSKSVLDFLLQYAESTDNVDMKEEVERLIHDYNNIILEPDASNLTILPYNRRDAYSILEYLKLQAEQLSEGRWTDFSDTDIGTVFLKLMSYLADMNNFQVDKVASELYLSTCTERASAIALCSLIGYEPRHYQSAHCRLTLGTLGDSEVPDGTEVPVFSSFTDASSTIRYMNLEPGYFYNNKCTLEVYQGSLVTKNYTINDISALGRIILPDYAVGTNTIQLTINGIKYRQVEDVRFISGELGYSVHISEDAYLYIQLPSWWPDVVTRNSNIKVEYLVSKGESGRIGKNTLSRIEVLSSPNSNYMTIVGNKSSIGGYDPETVDEMRISVPRQARTMSTIVTINDFEEVSEMVLGISGVAALDYNDPSSGLIQPDDYYKVYLYALPDADQYNPLDDELTRYRNTIIKEREDITIEDLGKVAEGVDEFSKASLVGPTITLEGVASVYTSSDDVLVGVDTGIESTSYLGIFLGNDNTPVGDTITLSYKLYKSGSDWILRISDNYNDLIQAGEKLAVYYKQEQVLTERGQALREFVDERRLTSLKVTYHPLEIVQPEINVEIYMDKNNIRFNTIEAEVLDFIVNKYSRKNIKIGEPIFASVIGSDILKEFDFIRYCEVGLPTTSDDKIEVLPKGFIDVVPYVLVLEDGVRVRQDKIHVQVFDYQNRVI